MQLVIYLDVLLLSNLWVNYLLLWATAKWTHRHLKTRRVVLSAMLGAGFSMMIFLPPQPAAVCLLLRFGTAMCMVLAAFGRLSVRDMIVQTIWFCILSFLFCGVVYAVSTWVIPIGLQSNNSVLYMDISLLVLLFASSAAAFFASCTVRKTDMPAVCDWTLHLWIEGQEFEMDALADTGSGLRDTFSGKPVVVCSRRDLRPWLMRYADSVDAASHCKGFRMLSASTVTGTRLLPVFTPESVVVTHKHRQKELDAMIAITEEQTAAIIPVCCLRG